MSYHGSQAILKLIAYGVTALCVPLHFGCSGLHYNKGSDLFALRTVPVAGLSSGHSLRGGQDSTALEGRRLQLVISGMCNYTAARISPQAAGHDYTGSMDQWSKFCAHLEHFIHFRSAKLVP
jgi:hypothetical protein